MGKLIIISSLRFLYNSQKFSLKILYLNNNLIYFLQPAYEKGDISYIRHIYAQDQAFQKAQLINQVTNMDVTTNSQSSSSSWETISNGGEQDSSSSWETMSEGEEQPSQFQNVQSPNPVSNMNVTTTSQSSSRLTMSENEDTDSFLDETNCSSIGYIGDDEVSKK